MIRSRWLWISWLLPLMLVACRQTGIQTPLASPGQAVMGVSDLIAYVGVDGNIYTIDRQGDRQTAVTDDADSSPGPGGTRSYQYLAWSPQGGRLAFVGIERGSGDTNRAVLYTTGAGGEDLVEAFTSEESVPFYLYWSPDSEHLSFLATSPEDTLNLHVLPAGGGVGRILDAGQPYYWDWAPDGQSLLVHVGGAAQGRLTFLGLGEELVQQSIDLQPTFFQAPAWSPDGSRILLAAELENEEHVLVLVNRDGKLEERIATFPGSIGFGWSEDGSRLAYIASQELSARGVLGPLTVYDLERGMESGRSPETTVYAFFWSPDGEKIAYFVPELASPGPSQEVAQRDHPVLYLALNLLDVISGETRRLARFLPTEEFLQVLPYFDQYQRSSTLWSPDSQHLVLSRIASSGGPEIVVIPVTGEPAPHKIADGVVAFWSR